MTTAYATAPATVAADVEAAYQAFCMITVKGEWSEIHRGVAKIAALRRQNLDSTALLAGTTRKGLQFWMGW